MPKACRIGLRAHQPLRIDLLLPTAEEKAQPRYRGKSDEYGPNHIILVMGHACSMLVYITIDELSSPHISVKRQ